MDYFSIPFNISLLRNHILKDHIVDWFIIQESLNCNKYEIHLRGDNNTLYSIYHMYDLWFEIRWKI